MCFGIDNLKVGLRIFAVSEYQNSTPQLFENEEHNSDTLAAKEMYNGLTFPRDEQYRTIHDELTMKHLLIAEI